MFKPAYNICRVAGIPIRAHFTLILLLLFVLARFHFPGLMIALAVILSITLHELGHSLVAIRKGCRVQEIMLMPIGGAAKMLSLPRRPKDELQVAAVGPGVSFALSLLGFLALLVFNQPASAPLAGFSAWFCGINLTLAIFNLIPAFPMDGGRILRALLTPKKGRVEATRIAAKTGQTLALVFGIWSFFRLLGGEPFALLSILIALYIHRGAAQEYQLVLFQEGVDRNPFEQFFRNQSPPPSGGAGGDDDFEVHVSPPPYAEKEKHVAAADKIRDFFRNRFGA